MEIQRTPIRLAVDLADAIPTLDDLIAYGVAEMRVVTAGPCGGNPAVTLTFHDGGGEGRLGAMRFLADWYGPDADAGSYVLTPAPGADRGDGGTEPAEAIDVA